MKTNISIFCLSTVIFRHNLFQMLTELFIITFEEAGLRRSHVSVTLPRSRGCVAVVPRWQLWVTSKDVGTFIKKLLLLRSSCSVSPFCSSKKGVSQCTDLLILGEKTTRKQPSALSGAVLGRSLSAAFLGFHTFTKITAFLADPNRFFSAAASLEKAFCSSS